MPRSAATVPRRSARRPSKPKATLHPSWLAQRHLALPVAYDGGAPCSTAAALARLRAVYFGLIAEVDHHLGRGPRRGSPTRESTLIVFTADHGEMLGDHWMLGKAGFFPQAFHVPLI